MQIPAPETTFDQSRNLDVGCTIRYNRSQLATPLVISMALCLFGLGASGMGFCYLPFLLIWMIVWTFIVLAVIRNLIVPPVLLRISPDAISLGRGGILTHADIRHFFLSQRLITTGRRSRNEPTLTVSIRDHTPVIASTMWKKDRASPEPCYFIETRYLDAPMTVVSEALRKAGVSMVTQANTKP